MNDHEWRNQDYPIIQAAVALPDLSTSILAARDADAERYRWLAEYLPSTRTDIDDAIVLCKNKGQLDATIDAARTAEFQSTPPVAGGRKSCATAIRERVEKK